MIRLVSPNELCTSDLVYPIFVREDGKSFEIPSLKEQEYLNLENVVKKCEEAIRLGIPAVMVFGVLETKDADGSIALDDDAFHPKIFKRLKNAFGDELVLISNVCLCDFTADEYCVYEENGIVLNEKTAEMLGKISVVHAEAGADIIAPAAMADGQVRHIRSALDGSGYNETCVMSYIKTNSCLFEPFFKTMSIHTEPRAGVDSSKFRPDVINEKMYMNKMDLDINEGADMVIVKPALPNLDHMLRTKERYPNIPIASYQVSGEYAMIKDASQMGHLDENSLIMETLKSIKRSGSDMIITYYALRAANLIQGIK